MNGADRYETFRNSQWYASLYGALCGFVWDDDSISFSIDIDESSTEKMSLCCSPHFLRMGQRHIEDAWVGRWVGGRIVPSDGQKCCGRTGFNSTIRCCCSSQVRVGAPRMISLSRGEGCGCFRIGLESCWEYSAKPASRRE